MKFKILLICVLLIKVGFAQSDDKYSEFVREAWNLYEQGEFQKSAMKYQDAFDQIDGKAVPGDRYNAACSYALQKIKRMLFIIYSDWL